MDSGASYHMTGRKDMVEELKSPLSEAYIVRIGDNSILEVLGRGKVVISHDTSIENVLLVKSLGFNLLSVYELSTVGIATYFDKFRVIAVWEKSLKVAFVGHVENHMYVVDFCQMKPLRPRHA